MSPSRYFGKNARQPAYLWDKFANRTTYLSTLSGATAAASNNGKTRPHLNRGTFLVQQTFASVWFQVQRRHALHSPLQTRHVHLQLDDRIEPGLDGEFARGFRLMIQLLSSRTNKAVYSELRCSHTRRGYLVASSSCRGTSSYRLSLTGDMLGSDWSIPLGSYSAIFTEGGVPAARRCVYDHVYVLLLCRRRTTVGIARYFDTLSYPFILNISSHRWAT